MKNLFVKTKNVKGFINLMNNLLNIHSDTPKMGLIYGDPGLGKTHTAVWWTTRNNEVYVRAQNKMTSKWLLEKIISELGEIPKRKMSDMFEQCINHLRLNPHIIVVDEIDYLVNSNRAIETLRDIHDMTSVPVVLIGMQQAKKKLCTYKHLYDRISEKLEFQTFNQDDVDIIVDELAEVKMTDKAKEIIFEKINRFRQLTKAITTLENLAQTNGLLKIEEKHVKGVSFEE